MRIAETYAEIPALGENGRNPVPLVVGSVSGIAVL